MVRLEGPEAAKPLSWSKGILPQMITLKHWLEEPNNWPQKRKNNIGNSDCWFDKRRKLWSGPNNNLVLPETLWNSHSSPCTCIKLLFYWQNDSIYSSILIENTKRATTSTYLTFPICPNYHPNKPVYTALRHFKSPNGSFKFQQTNFTEPLTSHGYKNILFTFCMLPYWTKIFPCK